MRRALLGLLALLALPAAVGATQQRLVFPTLLALAETSWTPFGGS